MIITGDISITDNINVVRDIIYSNTPNVFVVSTDESGAIPVEHNSVIGGLQLLPPIDALIAENDGDAESYQRIYNEWFTYPEVDLFVAALIISIMNGSNIIIYVDSVNSNMCRMLNSIFYKRYGITLGVIGYNKAVYDYSCIPIWLNYAYSNSCISGREYLTNMIVEASIPNNLMDKLLMEFAPVGESYNDKVRYIYSLVSKFKEKPNLIIPIYSA